MPISIRLGRVFGIEIGLHYSWFIIAALITLSLVGHFSATNPGWSVVLIWTTALATALLFFLSIVLHELSHALVALAGRLPVHSITLFALGGLAHIGKDAETPGREFGIAIAGPVASFAIGVTCLASAQAMGWTLQGGAAGPLPAMLGWLGYINIALAVFNLIPGYPLDGGRVLRAILWRLSGDAHVATRRAARTGQVVAMMFILLGLLQFVGGGGFGGLWIAFIGWFLLQASSASLAREVMFDSLRDVRVADVVPPESLAFDAEIREELDTTRALFVSPETSAADAFEIFVRDGVHQMPVVSQRRLTGILTLPDLLRFARRRTPRAY